MAGAAGLALAGALAGMAAAGGAAAATIVVNGSFEAGVPGDPAGLDNGLHFAALPATGGGWDRWTALDGWTTVAGPGIEVQTDRTLPGIDAQDGQYYVELDSTANAAMQQLVTLTPGSYALSFWYAPRTASAATNRIEWWIGGLAAGSVTGAFSGMWTEVTALFAVTAPGTYALRFAAAGGSDSYGGLIDNVAITPAPVPVPAGLPLLAGALALLPVLCRRRPGAGRAGGRD